MPNTGTRGHVMTNLLHDNGALRYCGSYNRYYIAWADYVNTVLHF